MAHRERTAPTCFLIAGAIAFCIGLQPNEGAWLWLSASCFIAGLYLVRENHQNAIEQRTAAANKASRDAEREQIERGN